MFIHSRAVPTVFVPIHLLIQILITENAVTAEQFRRGRQEQALKTTNFLAVDAKLILKDGELEDNWNTWVEEKMAVVQPVLDQLNK